MQVKQGLRGIMSAQFSDFLALSAISNLRISGSLNPSWNGKYRQIGTGFKPEGGSRLSIGNLNLKPPGPFLNYGNDLVYILTSNHYPILYVGVSRKGLQGVFGGNSRFYHHLIKVFAIEKSSGTNHTKGWQSHAVSRYEDLAKANSHSTAADDLFISIATCASNPKDHEGFILCSAFCEMQRQIGTASTIMVLNTGAMNYEPLHVAFPPNMSTIWKKAI
jgi:hypothetical protein